MSAAVVGEKVPIVEVLEVCVAPGAVPIAGTFGPKAGAFEAGAPNVDAFGPNVPNAEVNVVCARCSAL